MYGFSVVCLAFAASTLVSQARTAQVGKCTSLTSLYGTDLCFKFNLLNDVLALHGQVVAYSVILTGTALSDC